MPAKPPIPPRPIQALSSAQVADAATSRVLNAHATALQQLTTKVKPSVIVTSNLPANGSITLTHGLGQQAAHVSIAFTDAPVSGYDWSFSVPNATQITITTAGAARTGAKIQVS